MRILIAEDERITLRSLERRVAGWGHEVVIAANGLEAWTAFQQSHFDAILTDWQMPELDGLELIRRIRSVSDRAYTYVILLTSKSEKTDLVAGLDAGADDFLSKPFDPGELQARLNAGQRVIGLERTLAAKNAAMQADLDAAADYVRSLLPAPLTTPVAIDWRYIPAGDLAGDSLGYHWIDREHLALYVIDVTGHGVDAAFLSVTVLNVLKTMSLPDVEFTNPARVLEGLNRRFPMEEHQDRCFTAWYGVYDVPNRSLQWSGGGHPPAVLFSNDGQAAELPSTGPMLGMWPTWDGSNQSRAITAGEKLLILSDGVFEIEDAAGRQGEWAEFLMAARDDVAAGKKLLEVLPKNAITRRGQPTLEDDFTLVEVQF